MRRVAANADVPPSTLQRLARALDFSTYDQFRNLYRDTINRFSEGVSIKAGHVQEVAAEVSMDHAINAYQQSALGNITTLFDHIDRDVLDRAATALTNARTVLVVGMHSSHAFANYLHYLAAMGFRNWRLLVRHNGELSYLVEALTPEDVVVAVSIEPSSAGTIEVARRARDAGARVVGITDRRTSPLASRSDDLLLIPIQSPQLLPVLCRRGRPGRDAGRHDRGARRPVGGRQHRQPGTMPPRDGRVLAGMNRAASALRRDFSRDIGCGMAKSLAELRASRHRVPATLRRRAVRRPRHRGRPMPAWR